MTKIRFLKTVVKSVVRGEAVTVKVEYHTSNAERNGVVEPIVAVYVRDDYTRNLRKIFGDEVQCGSDSMRDYFETPFVPVFPDSPYYQTVLAYCK